MIRSIFLFLILTPLWLTGQNLVIENDSLLLWNKDRLLKWEDFKGKGKSPSKVNVIHQVAEIIPIIRLVYLKNEQGIEKETFLCYFSKKESWSITKDPKILEHEQLHFDLMEVFTRRIRKKYVELDSLGITDFAEYDLHVSKIMKECRDLNDQYDKEVLLNFPKQHEWRKCIDKELEELKEYEYIPED